MTLTVCLKNLLEDIFNYHIIILCIRCYNTIHTKLIRMYSNSKLPFKKNLALSHRPQYRIKLQGEKKKKLKDSFMLYSHNE